MRQSQVLGQVQIAVAKRILQTEQQAGAGVLQLLQSAVGGTNAAAANVGAAVQGLGSQLDVTG